jgi:hypothetical protein
MKVDLSYDELVLLIQLVNQRFVEMARKDPPNPATFETALFKKLYEAHLDEMDVIDPSHDHRTGLPL